MTTIKAGWDFSALPESEHARAVEAVEALDYGMLLELHDRYQLSPYNYCCAKEALLVWFRYGIASGQIKKQNDVQQK